ncbi:MAG TPA: FAD/NAD(P)-binding protein [Kutzneria sp.]
MRICVVGAGPRGTSVLERIVANRAPGVPVEVHVIDPYPPGAGSVWRISQPDALLMNTVASQVSLYTDDSVVLEGPIVPGPSLHEWAEGVIGDEYPEQVRAEAADLGPDTYPSRALYGYYLEWVFTRLVADSGDVSVTVHRGTAVAVDDQPDGRQTVRLKNGSTVDGLDAVVLALGHGPVVLTEEETRLRDFAAERALTYIPPSNPADLDLSRIEPGEKVALRGLGLNFFDYLALFTEGRGGRYERTEDGLVYHSSGLEPSLYAGSRRGVPHHARGENQKGPVGRHRPVFLTPSVIERLRASGRVRFMHDVWPLIDKEARAVYYATLLADRLTPVQLAEFSRRHGQLLRSGEDDDALLARFGVVAEELWNWERIAKPYGEKAFADQADYQRWLLGYLRSDAREAKRGNVSSPLKAALDTLRDLRNEIRLVVDHGGITGGSYRDELARWYTPFNAFLSIGPPLRRIEEMTALLEAGVLRVLGPGVRVRLAETFMVDATSVPAPPIAVTTLIEARIPDVDLSRSANPLLRYLKAAGQCRSFHIPDEGSESFESGGVAVTGRPYHVIDAANRPHPARFAYGVPTEYVHWVTAAGIRPGVGSVTLEDSDAIARAALAVRPPRPMQDGRMAEVGRLA